SSKPLREIREAADARTGTLLGFRSKHARGSCERVAFGIGEQGRRGRMADPAERAKLCLGGGFREVAQEFRTRTPCIVSRLGSACPRGQSLHFYGSTPVAGGVHIDRADPALGASYQEDVDAPANPAHSNGDAH